METAFFSPASVFHGDDSDDGQDEMQVDTEGKKQALEYVERVHDRSAAKIPVYCTCTKRCYWSNTFSSYLYSLHSSRITYSRRLQLDNHTTKDVTASYGYDYILRQLRELSRLAERMAALMCVHLDMRTEVEESDEQDREESGSLEHVSQVVEKERPRIQERGDDFAAWLELD